MSTCECNMKVCAYTETHTYIPRSPITFALLVCSSMSSEIQSSPLAMHGESTCIQDDDLLADQERSIEEISIPNDRVTNTNAAAAPA